MGQALYGPNVPQHNKAYLGPHEDLPIVDAGFNHTIMYCLKGKTCKFTVKYIHVVVATVEPVPYVQ